MNDRNKTKAYYFIRLFAFASNNSKHLIIKKICKKRLWPNLTSVSRPNGSSVKDWLRESNRESMDSEFDTQPMCYRFRLYTSGNIEKTSKKNRNIRKAYMGMSMSSLCSVYNTCARFVHWHKCIVYMHCTQMKQKPRTITHI